MHPARRPRFARDCCPRARLVATGVIVVFTIFAGGCGDGSGSSQTRYSLSLQSDAPCYGVRAEIDLGALKKAEGSCELSEEASVAGCSADISTQGEVLAAEARGCLLASGTPVFDCRLATDQASNVEAATTVTYGCGCQDTCPTTVSLDTEAGLTLPADGDTEVAYLDASKRPVVVETAVASTTTSTTCGTCCDYFETLSVDMQAATRVTEIAFLFSFATGGDECSFYADDCEITVGSDGPGYLRKNGRTLEVCISDSVGIDATATLMECEFIAPSPASPPLTVVRAGGEQLQTLDPPPTLTLRSNF